ncbi:DUF3047 domain-containing protein [Roseateles albus]|uniref:DUF3047 domain-containing protein n=1 Tax=Roseateles albus TaxID=2987525 RepID=A0ABT5KC98_9BURK|nr:DUF3047 domain-containing protein [Roseateles albus]MDC8771561.1 DUF3047 domain-containing protein [Roseateles albus]
MPEALVDWSAKELPGKRVTQYSLAKRGGQDCVLAQAAESVSLWRRALKIEPEQLEAVQFDWWIHTLDARSSVQEADTDDAPARLLLGFAGDEGSLSLRNRMQFELVQTLTGEAPPFATLMYVWDAHAAPETVLISTRSDRVRKIVVGSGEGGRGTWQRLRRNVRADYMKAFGEEPGRLTSMAMMTDGDNTRSRAEACYGNILLLDAHQQALKGSLQF